MTKDIDLDALQALAEKATPGSWRFSRESWNVTTEDYELDIGVYIPEDETDMTGEFIAAANPQTILSLIARIRDLERRVGASAWQPIETAPKDRRVLVRTEREVYAAHWAKNPFTGDEAWIVAEWGDEGDQALVKPIEWMPAPSAVRAAPEGGKEGGMA